MIKLKWVVVVIIVTYTEKLLNFAGYINMLLIFFRVN